MYSIGKEVNQKFKAGVYLLICYGLDIGSRLKEKIRDVYFRPGQDEPYRKTSRDYIEEEDFQRIEKNRGLEERV